jgi:hypothetical protein
MAFFIVIDGSYGYSVSDTANPSVAIRRACAEHDVKAKARQATGKLTPLTISQLARTRGVTIRCTKTGDKPVEEE